MRTTLLTFLLFYSFYFGQAQVTAAVEKYALNATLSESSGLIYYNGKIITHNDSDGAAALYEMDPTDPNSITTVTINGANNVDWEDITQDDNYIYIGDIGNNEGTRTDLKIYKISKTEYDSGGPFTIETINFSYQNQTTYTANANATPWDAETLISIDANNLLIVSKNWETFEAQTYVVPKTPGTHELMPQASTLPDPSGNYDLITGGTYNPLTGKVYLVGYTSNTNTFNALRPFIYECSGFSGTDIFSGTNTQYDISGASLGNFSYEQIEGITYVDADTYYGTSETFDTGIGVSDYGKLIEVSTSDVALSVEGASSETFEMYPNPTRDIVQINTSNAMQVEVYNMQAQRLMKTYSNTIDLSAFRSGMYLFKIMLNEGQPILKKVLKY